ncbi:hypothetical protein VTJ49DRAFT_1304 [Mycothermus thermophilus]|uniref:Peptidase S33 tripeptidyl aminopeptidase-like C-terminal domain-containing protein n=1 Tax=Humicola insolens TaxID=85995 RepID=A0ABR3VEG0_HUMIN
MHLSSIFSTIGLASLALAGPVQVAERQAQKLRIMPLGDSITEITCWRAFVWDQLAEAGLANQVQYVGSQNSNPQGCRPNTPNWDQRHEGHSGWLAIDIANNYLTNWLRSTPADIVMFMLGTNDVFRGRSTNDIINAYTKMVQIMRAANPRMKIIVDLVIPLSFNNGPITQLNARIPEWARSLNTTESPIVIADCYTGFNAMSDLRDGVHPSLSGDRLIASRVGPLLLNYVRQALEERGHALGATFWSERALHGAWHTAVRTTQDSGIAGPDLSWHPCYTFYNPSFLCARLTVPMDYSRPLNSSSPVPKVHIALLLLPGQGSSSPSALNSTSSTPQPKQPLLINPGGPGGSGVITTLLLGSSLQKVLGADQPILAFDPRGIAFTTPMADCWAVPWTDAGHGHGDRGDTHGADDDNEGNTAAGLMHRLEWERVNQAYGLVSEGEPWMRYLDVAQRGVVELCRRHAESVEQRKDTILRWAGTRHVARDMLSIVDAWERWVYGKRTGAESEVVQGDEGLRGKLVYWGFSYGTYLGATFAKMFPDRVGRVMLDGVVDAVGYEEAVWPESLVDADKVLGTFFKYCVETGPKCDLYRAGDSAEDIQQRYEAVMDRLQKDPITFTHPDHYYPVVLSYRLVKLLVFGVLYQPIQGFPILATLLNYIYAGEYERLAPLFQSGELLCTLASNPLLSETMSDAQRAIMCSDKTQPMNMTLPELTATYKRLSKTSQFADIWFNSMSKCNTWDLAPLPIDPWAASAPLSAPKSPSQIETANPILFLSNTYDPVTPLSAAVKMARRFRGAGLLEQLAQGHCTIAAVSRCTAKVIREYLASGTVPEVVEHEGKESWQSCAADEAPWKNVGSAEVGAWTAEEREYPWHPGSWSVSCGLFWTTSWAQDTSSFQLVQKRPQLTLHDPGCQGYCNQRRHGRVVSYCH